jgi:zinc transport system substrate-binding protein
MRFLMQAAVLAIGIFALAGCDRGHDEAHEHPAAGAPTAAHDHGDGHDHPHGDQDHDHDDPHTETFFGPDAGNDDEDEHAHDDEEPHEH